MDAESTELTVELIRILPNLLSLLFLLLLIAVFYKPIRYELLPRLSGFKAFGAEATFIRQELDKAVEEQATQISEGDRLQILHRAQLVAPFIKGAQILWVDDNPDNNRSERRILQSLGMVVDLALSTQQALSMLKHTKYDVVISDMKRDGVEDEGVRFANEMVKQGLYRWTIIYMGGYDPSRGTPPYVFGITNRPDHLMHYALDILERERI